MYATRDCILPSDSAPACGARPDPRHRCPRRCGHSGRGAGDMGPGPEAGRGPPGGAAPRADHARPAGSDPRDRRPDQQGHLREPGPARPGGCGQAAPGHELGDVARREDVDVQAARRRQVPRRDGLRRPGREVHAGPGPRRLRGRLVQPGVPGSAGARRGRRPADDPPPLQEAVPGPPRRAGDRLPRHRLAGGGQEAREGVRSAPRRDRPVHVRELDPGPAGRAQEEPGLQLGAGPHEAPGSGLRGRDPLPLRPGAPDAPGDPREGRGRPHRPRAPGPTSPASGRTSGSSRTSTCSRARPPCSW